MDRETRNRTQRATQAARSLLESEYAEQLEGVFDIRLDGTVGAEAGAHLDPAQRVLRKKLVAAVVHHEAGGFEMAEAVQAYLREAAFTTLNRFVALKMLEARGLVLESVSQGDQSSGFKEFTGLAPGLVQLPDHGYRLYIESLFDEIGREVRVLFDRRDPASLLWPRRQALHDLLEILNAPGLSSVWIEDETIGWVYQYFNGEDERRAMREASQAPRNSRELAARNQFFTPRYVVQFLVDNTLGRTWFEMNRGETILKGLDFLVRRQHEVFLAEGEPVPEGTNFGATRESPFPVPFLAKKDPRDLKILDPACGSGHFLLYTFDLLVTIYEEAWQDDGSTASVATGRTLRADYPNIDVLRTEAPKLILLHNLHGIDIDPRAAQIAALALWLRAQRVFQEAGLSRTERPAIKKTNVVVAEPMPGEADLRDVFIASLEPKLGKLVERVFECMSLAGEAGYLLRIAEQIEESIRQIYGAVGGLLEQAEESEWAQAAKDLRTALETFATSAVANETFVRQLFVGDAARGLGFIDVCSQTYDVLLMNPPFGQCTPATYPLLRGAYRGVHSDIYSCFLARATELSNQGRVGAVTSRSFIVAPRLESFRRDVVLPRLDALLDLGLGVMDDARVEAAAYVLDDGQSSRFLAADCRVGRSFDATLLHPPLSKHLFHSVPKDLISCLPQAKFLYSMPSAMIDTFRQRSPFEPDVGTAREGMKSFDNERFVRAAWECPYDEVGRGKTWQWFVKGGEQAFYYATPHLLLNWREEGAELRSVNLALNGSTAQVRQASTYWFRAGATYSKRSAKGFSARALPAGCVFSSNGPAVLSESSCSDSRILGWLNSRLIRALIHMQSNFGDYSTGAIKRLPWSSRVLAISPQAEQALHEAISWLIQRARQDETDAIFAGCRILFSLGTEESGLGVGCNPIERAMALWDDQVAAAYGIDSLTWTKDLLSTADGSSTDGEPGGRGIEEENQERTDAFELISWALGVALGRFDLRIFTGERSVPPMPGPFDPVPPCQPGMLTGADGLPPREPPSGYPVDFPRDGILVDDPGAERDVVAAARQVFEPLFDDPASRWEGVAEILDDRDRTLRAWLAKEFFAGHMKRYSKSKRKAPIYWQLATPSASYSAWLYYHRFSRDTLFLLNEHITPKLQHEERKLTSLTQEAGLDPSSTQRKEIDGQETFVGELRAFREEVARVAPLWNPNLNDGVILNFAPLWRLVPQHRVWQRECKSKWDELCSGEYDWAHLAMHLWPERVVPKCAEDRSLAITHGLESVFWYEDEDGQWQPNAGSEEEVARLVSERTSPAVKDALKCLLEAPAVLVGRGRGARAETRRVRRVRSVRSHGAPGGRVSRSAGASRTVDRAVLDRVRSAIGSIGDGAAKSDILTATGVTDGQWSLAIRVLLEEGTVIRTGERRGARYHLVGGNA